MAGDYAFIGAGHGGYPGHFAAVVGGAYNTSLGQFLFVGTGQANTNLGLYGAIVAGSSNFVATTADAAFIGHDGAPSPEMAAYIEAEGLDFGMASPARYADALRSAGFTDITVTSRNAWYREAAQQELERLRGPVGAAAASIVGQDFVDQNIAIWTRMVPVLRSGEHCPTHLRARRPG